MSPIGVYLVIEGEDVIRERFRQAPQVLQSAERSTMEASLMVLQESTPGYPSQPEDSSYRRTGTLGRTLGADGGRAEIFEVKPLGASGVEGSFGTRLGYADYVIGEGQAWMHKGRWWTLPGTVINRAKGKIERLWQVMVDELARYLNG